jgi:opacity protein-like surface antigen
VQQPTARLRCSAWSAPAAAAPSFRSWGRLLLYVTVGPAAGVAAATSCPQLVWQPPQLHASQTHVLTSSGPQA